MKYIFLRFLTFILSISWFEDPDCLKSDLDQYNGFYSSAEMKEGILSPKNIPLEILEYQNQNVELISIKYLQKIHEGYLLLFNVKYSNYKSLVLSTLDNSYCLQDFRIYPDNNQRINSKEDTIAFPRFHGDYVTIELLKPNENNEPLFQVDGLWKEKLLIHPNLKIELEEKIIR